MNAPPTTTITDSAGRTLACYLDLEAVVDGTTYGLLTPVDTPVVLVRRGEDGAEDDVLEWKDHEDILSAVDHYLEVFGTNSKLIRSAGTLTVSDPLKWESREDVLSSVDRYLKAAQAASDEREPAEDEDDDEDGEYEEFIAFEHTDGRIYDLCIPLDPFFVVAKARGFTGELLEGDEFKRIMPEIERVLEVAG